MMKTQNTTHKRQQGIALVVFAIGMVVIIGIAGLALDLGRLMLDDARLQNALDACALSGAQVLMEASGNASAKMSDAEAAAKDTFSRNLESGWTLTPVVRFSDTLKQDPFTSTTSPRYVQCEVDNHSISTTLARIFNIKQLGLNVTAVAGPAFVDNCDFVPMVVCGDCGLDGCDKADDCAPGDDQCFGFNVYKEGITPPEEEHACYLKACPPGNNCQQLVTGEDCGAQAGAPDGGGSWAADISAGNFDLLDKNCVRPDGSTINGGVPCLKAVLRGEAKVEGGCSVSDPWIEDTKPGNTNTVIDAFNTLFDGPSRDTVSTSPLIYSQYNKNYPPGGNRRREIGIPIADCSSPIIKPGKTEIPILTVGKFFATERAVKSGGKGVIWGQFVGELSGKGDLSKTPDAFDTYKIVLYKDYKGPDS